MDVQSKKLFVTEKLKKNISRVDGRSGYIAGWERDGEIYCLAMSACTDYFLTGLEVLGIFCILEADSQLEEDELLSTCKRHIDVLKVEFEEIVVLLYKPKSEGSDVHMCAKLFSQYSSNFESLEILDMVSNPAVLLRACGQIPLTIETSCEITALKENIELAIERLRSFVQSEVPAFLLKDTSFILHNNIKSDSSMTFKDLLKYADLNSAENVQKFKHARRKHPLHFDILIQATGDSALQNTVNHSVVIHCQRRVFQCISLCLPFDVLVVCNQSDSVYIMYKTFISAIVLQVEKMMECLFTYAKNLEFVTPVPYHFFPEEFDIPITIIYPLNKSDNELENYRRHLHKLLLLPMDRPFLRKLNTYDFTIMQSGCLINPHEGLSPSGVSDGRTAVVRGRYTYHHYMQDHVDDNGWGCAYRSLQTIVSWFKFQGYTDRSIPTHTEIQQALVDIGDKPKSFVGTKQWIGSQEVSFCLDHLIQVQSKIMTVSSGAEMANKGRELFMHFHDQGTPVMIGGGVLAHTILGVDFNQNTGELKFLILDPHYTGSEDLHAIQNKGWCGWKSLQFWDQHSFYNVCLPQRPLLL